MMAIHLKNTYKAKKMGVTDVSFSQINDLELL